MEINGMGEEEDLTCNNPVVTKYTNIRGKQGSEAK